MSNLTILKRIGQTKFIVKGLEGRITLRNTGNSIAASMEHRQFFKGLGARTCKHNPSYIEVKPLTTQAFAKIMMRISNHV